MFAFGGVIIVQKSTRVRDVVFLRAKRAKIRHGCPRVNFCTMVTPPNANIFGTLPYAEKEVVFTSGEAAHNMYVVKTGACLYIYIGKTMMEASRACCLSFGVCLLFFFMLEV